MTETAAYTASSAPRPRGPDADTILDAGHVKTPLLNVIRAFCIKCSGQVRDDVKKCTSVKCQLWPYRMGKNPFSARVGNINSIRRD